MFDPSTAPAYLCGDDFFTTNEGPFAIRATLRHDPFTKPEEFEYYTDEDIAGWQRDEWFFGTLTLTVAFDGIDLGLAYSMNGCEVNLDGQNGYLLTIANHMIPEALDDAKARLREIKDKLALIDL